MPVVKEYISQTQVQGPLGVVAPSFDFGGIAKAAQGFSATLEQRAEQRELSDINATLAQVRAEWTAEIEKRAREAPLGATDFVAEFSQDFRNAIGELGGRYSTRAGILAWGQHSRELEAQFGLTATRVQGDLAGAKVREDLKSAARLNGNTLRHDPAQFDAVLGQTMALIDTPSYASALSAEERAKFKGEIASELAEAAFNGVVRQNPSLALQQLESGAFDAYVDADRALRLRATAETALRAQEIEANRALVARDKAETAASEAAMDGYIADIFSATPKASAVDIATDNRLKPQHKLTMLGVIERSTKPDPLSEISHQNSSALFARLHLPDGDPNKITDENALNQQYIDGLLNRTDLDWLRKEFQAARTPEGDMLGKRRKDFFDAIEPQINQRGVFGVPTDPTGGEQFYRYQQMVLRKEKELRDAGKDPFSLYDPNSPDYVGKPETVGSFKKTLTQQIESITQGLGVDTPTAPTAIDQPQGADVSRATATASDKDGRKIYLIDGVWQFATGQAVQ